MRLVLILLIVSLAAPAGARRGTIVKRADELSPPASGPADALVTFERFCDLAVPSCAALDGALERLLAAHPDDVRVIYRTLPMSHVALSQGLAELAWEAHAQGKHADFLATLHRASSSERRDWRRLAERAGLDVAAAERALADGRHKPRVAADVDWAQRLGIDGAQQLALLGEPLPYPRDTGDLEARWKAARALALARIAGGVPRVRLYRTLLRERLAARADQVWVGSNPDKTRPLRVNVPSEGAPWRGADDAEILLVAFGEYTSGASRALARNLLRLEEVYPGRLRIVWKHAPGESRPESLGAARAAACAARQDRFWDYHLRLFAQPYRLDREHLVEFAQNIGLDVDRFTAELDGGACEARVLDDLADARALGVESGAPALFINGRRLPGDTPLASLRVVIDDELEPGELAEWAGRD